MVLSLIFFVYIRRILDTWKMRLLSRVLIQFYFYIYIHCLQFRKYKCAAKCEVLIILIYHSIEYCLMLSVSVAHREYLTLLTEKIAAE